MANARGAFEVKLLPLDSHAKDEMLGRRSIDKTFSGDLVGTSVGEMLSAGTTTKGSAAYVAIEKVTGTLGGKKGTFVFVHRATMNRGNPALEIDVVPDSGTDELVGLKGSIAIAIADGKHSYDFTYELG